MNAENSNGSEPKRVYGRPFLPGQSGNPGGRPKQGTTFTDIIRNLPVEDKEAVVLKMLELAKAGNSRCAEWLADRSEGKARVTMDVNEGENDVYRDLLESIRNSLNSRQAISNDD